MEKETSLDLVPQVCSREGRRASSEDGLTAAFSAGGLAEALAQRDIHFEDIDELDADQSSQWCLGSLIEHVGDFLADRCGVSPCQLGPLVGHAIELIQGVLERDVRVEARPRGH